MTKHHLSLPAADAFLKAAGAACAIALLCPVLEAQTGQPRIAPGAPSYFNPSVLVATPPGISFDRVQIQYLLRSPASRRAPEDIVVQYSTNGTKGPFLAATEAKGTPSEGTSGLHSGPLGIAHTFVWDSFRDLDPAHFTHGNVVVRINGNGQGQTKPFAIDNRLLATVAGHVLPGGIGDGAPANNALIDVPYSCHAVGPHTLIYVDPIESRVREFTIGGDSVTLAGDGIGYSGDGGPAGKATLNFPVDAVMDSNGVVFIADAGNVSIRAVNPKDGTIQTVAADPRFINLSSLRVLPGNQLLIVDSGALQIFRLSYTVDSSGNASGNVDVVLGTGNPGTAPVDGIAATDVDMGPPTGDLQDDGNGTIYYTEYGSLIRKFSIGGTVTTVAGSYQDTSYSGDGGLASAATFSVDGLAYDGGTGFIYFADPQNNVVRRFTDGGTIETVAGTGAFAPPSLGQSATASALPSPGFLAIDPSGGAVVVSSSATHRFYGFPAGGAITLAAGKDQSGALVGNHGPAPAAVLATPLAAAAPNGDLFVVEEGFGRLIRVDAATGLISNVLGNGIPEFSGIPGPLNSANLDTPTDLAIAADGSLLIPSENEAQVLGADWAHNSISVIAGGGTFGTGGDGGLATQAQFITPSSVAVSRTTGAIYVGDEGSATVRMIDAQTGIITTVAGGGSDASSENIQATDANLVFPTGIAVDGSGNLYICENSPASVIRKVTPDGKINTVAGVPFSSGFNGDGPAQQALLNAPNKVAVDGSGTLYICDQGNSLVRRVDLNGNLKTIMGNGSNGDAQDGTKASGAPLNGPWKVDVDDNGNIFVSEFYGARVRRFRAD
jgi:sugar lactone lactonase YvrE